MAGRADWMSGRYGLMTHWLFPDVGCRRGKRLADLNEAVERFDVDALVAGVDAAGADWFIFTIGQNTGYYFSPNEVIDRRAGAGHCSKRDLVGDIARAVHRKGKRFLAYLPCEVAGNKTMQAGFEWNTAEGTSQDRFQTLYLEAARAWALQFGRNLDGWWIDGCYDWQGFHKSKMRWGEWCAALRAGNPDAALGFNDGSLALGIENPLTPMQDYLAGETDMIMDGKLRFGRKKGFSFVAPGWKNAGGTSCQWHSLLPIDCRDMNVTYPDDQLCNWMHEFDGEMFPPRFSDDNLFSFVRSALSAGGAVTLNCGSCQEGFLGEKTVEHLVRLRETLRRMTHT